MYSSCINLLGLGLALASISFAELVVVSEIGDGQLQAPAGPTSDPTSSSALAIITTSMSAPAMPTSPGVITTSMLTVATSPASWNTSTTLAAISIGVVVANNGSMTIPSTFMTSMNSPTVSLAGLPSDEGSSGTSSGGIGVNTGAAAAHPVAGAGVAMVVVGSLFMAVC